MSLRPLPIDSVMPEILASIRRRDSVVLTATPGAGKTTRLPPKLLEVVSGQVIVLEPRRMAAVAACHRVCEEQGWRLGQEAGYQVRFESKISSKTRLVFMTEALLLRRLIDDPELKGIDLVVIDEFHERSLNQDLVLGYLREFQELGREIKILIMSATIDGERLGSYLRNSEVVDVPGQVFDLDLRYQSQPLYLRTDRAFYERVVESVSQAHRETSGDILVFLPGMGEIQKTQDRLVESGLRGRDIVALHGSLPLDAQQRVLRAPEKPRVILSTNVAEASVTVQGVDYVIDTGLAKVMQTHLRTGFSQLELSRISQFNARQRSGRAAREKAGISVRLWTSFEETTQLKEPVPECQRADLSQAVLLLSHLGVTRPSAFSWYDFPPQTLLSLALRSLRSMRAIDDQGALTSLGRRLLQFPLPPRWGALLALGEARGIGRVASRVAAILSERDFVDGEDLKTASSSSAECDLSFRLELLEDFARGQAPRYVHRRSAQNILDVASQLEGMLQIQSATDASETTLSEVLLASQRDRLCRRRGSSERALMTGGRGVRLESSSQVRKREFFVALQGIDLPNQADTQIRIASGFPKDFILNKLADEISVREDVWFDEEKQQFFSRRVRAVGDLPLEEPVLRPATPELVGENMVNWLCDHWEAVVLQHEGLLSWFKRWRFLTHHKNDLVSELTAESIRRAAEMGGYGRVTLAEVLSQDLVGYLESALEPQLVKSFTKEVPASFLAPSGVRHPVIYDELHAAYVDVRLQEMFGQSESPRILNGSMPITFRLLGPNFRPVQVTSDLASFWRNGYPEVRKDLRARYPKHSWPEDPMTATPEAKGRRRH